MQTKMLNAARVRVMKHVWYLTPELVVLSLFDESEETIERANIAKVKSQSFDISTTHAFYFFEMKSESFPSIDLSLNINCIYRKVHVGFHSGFTIKKIIKSLFPQIQALMNCNHPKEYLIAKPEFPK